LLAPQREGNGRVFNQDDRDSLAFILRGKRLGFTLAEIREMLLAGARGFAGPLPINRGKCVEQIAMLEKQLREIDSALAELRQIYAEMFDLSRAAPTADTSGAC
jgi:DNA-binding transcriptional MerR regulator